jgi:hypothetical protein
MLSRLYEFLINRPAVARQLGSLLWRFGSFGLFCGLLAHLVHTILSAAASMGAPGQHPDLQSLYPGVPIWWIPESPPGFGVYIALMVSGFTISILAADLQRTMRSL